MSNLHKSAKEGWHPNGPRPSDAPVVPWKAEDLLLPGAYRNLGFSYDEPTKALFCFMQPKGRPSFTPELLRDLLSAQQVVARGLKESEANSVRYVVLGSRSDGPYSLGGDLVYFQQCIRSQDRQALTWYAHCCAEIVYNSYLGYGGRATTIAMVQGHALGGGFEAALSCHVLIAERRARFGLPETLFNLFPGMGAYSFLSRRLTAHAAERLILSGSVFTAEQMYEQGLVDVLCDDGEGPAAVLAYIKQHDRQFTTRQALGRVRQQVHPLTRQELVGVTNIWVDCALGLSERDLTRMDRLIKLQVARKPGVADRESMPAGLRMA